MPRYIVELPATVAFTVRANDPTAALALAVRAAQEIAEDEVLTASGSAYVAVDTAATAHTTIDSWGDLDYEG